LENTRLGITGERNEDLVIKDGRISGFYHGLYCTIMDNSRIERLAVSSNDNVGVYLKADGYQCNGNTIADCTVSDNPGTGVFLNGYVGQCDGNTIQENRISKNANRGIYLSYADGNRVEANNVWSTTGGGVTCPR
jgi:parallel beta-helix repeat protein